MPSPSIEAFRRRVTPRLMHGLLRAHATTDARLPRTGIHRVLVCRSVSTLGDSLTLTPLLVELSKVYPGAEVDLVSRCAVADALYGAFPNVRDIHHLPRHIAAHVLSTADSLRGMRRKRYDLVIDPDPQSQSGRLLALMAHARYVLGYVGPDKRGRLTHGIAVPAGLRHKARMPVYLLRRALGEDPGARGYPEPRLRLADAELENGRRTLAQLLQAARAAATREACVAVFANATGDKLLAPAWWQAFCDALGAAVPNCRIVEILPASGASMLGDRFPCYFSTSVRRIAALIAAVDGYVSADCGVMHLAWASGAPTIGLFGVTDAAEWGPFGPHAAALQLETGDPVAVARRVAERFALPRARSAIPAAAPATRG